MEVGSRSLSEPAVKAKVGSFVASVFPQMAFNENETNVIAAVAEKTFLEKSFLLHELFSTDGCRNANRKSRHLYDLSKMLEAGIADKAILDDELWETIRHHREVFTSIRDVDYTPDVRRRITLVPPDSVIEEWKKDYDTMVMNMIYEDKVPTFADILRDVSKIERMFRSC